MSELLTPARTVPSADVGADALHQLLSAMVAMRDGDFSAQLPRHWDGLEGRLAGAFNRILAHNRRLAAELDRAGDKVGRAGGARRRMPPAPDANAWVQMERSINALVGNLERVDAGAEERGLGLVPGRHTDELHGGDEQAHRAGPGEGRRFTARLPGAAPADATAAPGPAHASAPTAPRRRVLVVDDNPDSADTLAMMLELLGHDAQRLYDPHAAVEAVARFEPQVVFLDIGMPGLNGCELARQLRAAPGGGALTLVAVTGWGQPEDRRRTHEAGFDHHLVKPPEVDAIQRVCAARPAREGVE